MNKFKVGDRVKVIGGYGVSSTGKCYDYPGFYGTIETVLANGYYRVWVNPTEVLEYHECQLRRLIKKNKPVYTEQEFIEATKQAMDNWKNETGAFLACPKKHITREDLEKVWNIHIGTYAENTFYRVCKDLGL